MHQVSTDDVIHLSLCAGPAAIPPPPFNPYYITANVSRPPPPSPPPSPPPPPPPPSPPPSPPPPSPPSPPPPSPPVINPSQAALQAVVTLVGQQLSPFNGGNQVRLLSTLRVLHWDYLPSCKLLLVFKLTCKCRDRATYKQCKGIPMSCRDSCLDTHTLFTS